MPDPHSVYGNDIGEAESSTGVSVRGLVVGAARATANTDDDNAQIGRGLTMVTVLGFCLESCRSCRRL